MPVPERFGVLALVLAPMLLAGCSTTGSPLVEEPSGEDARFLGILDAEALGDCAQIYTLSQGFETRFAARLDRVSFAVGLCRYQDGELDAAARLLDGVRVRPGKRVSREALYYAGRTRYRQRDFPAAIERFDRLLACCAGVREDNAWYFRTRSVYRQGENAVAREGFAKLLALPDASASYRARALYYTGKTYYREGLADPGDGQLFATARGWYDQVLADYPDQTIADDALYATGKAYFRTAEFSEAEAAFAKVLEDYPGQNTGPRAEYYLGRTLVERGRYELAIARLDGFGSRYPDSAVRDNAGYHLARAWYRWGVAKGDDPEALRTAHGLYLALLDAFPDTFYTSSALYFAGRALYRIRDREAALPLFERLVERHATDPSSYADNAHYYAGMSAYYLGVSARDTALWERAVGHFERLAADFPESSYRAAAAYFGGRALTRLGRLEEAIVSFEYLVVSAAGSTYFDNALLRLIELRLDRADCPGARAALEQMQREAADSPLLSEAITAVEIAC